MDTDELTEMAYKTILIASERNDYLMSEIASMTSEFKDEWDLTENLKEEVLLKDIDFLINHVDKTIKTPKIKRGKEGI